MASSAVSVSASASAPISTTVSTVATATLVVHARFTAAALSTGALTPAQPVLWAASTVVVGSAVAKLSTTASSTPALVGVAQPSVTQQAREKVEWWRREPVSYSAETYRLVPSFLNLDDPLGDVIDHHYEYEILPNGKKVPAKPRTIPYPQR